LNPKRFPQSRHALEKPHAVLLGFHLPFLNEAVLNTARPLCMVYYRTAGGTSYRFITEA
jgi:hypothetical protein